MKESKNLEFKSDISASFLKTVSAFANYDGGTVIFGVDDSGAITGLNNIKDKCLAIENKINDNIKPQPDFSIFTENTGKTITLKVSKGSNPPYLYKSKAYKRNDTSTVEVNNMELSRLILEGQNLNFEELPAHNQKLNFSFLEKEIKFRLKLDRFDFDVLKTLNLYSDNNGYNKAADILSDNCSFPGIDIAKFGENINVFQKRLNLEKQSVLESYYSAVEMYRDYYQYEVVEGIRRRTIEKVPEEAFREAVANAVIHRSWDVNASIRISMFDDRIEIVSPGGLPNGISKESYYEGKVSVLRNPILANVFHRLSLKEKFATGIRRIKKSYEKSRTQPIFYAAEDYVQVTLPVIKENLGLTPDESAVFDALSNSIRKSISDILSTPGVIFGKSKTTELLKKLVEKGLVAVEGQGRGTRYYII